MPNMSYCRFENTSNDLFDCNSALLNMAEEEQPLTTLNEYERRGAKKLYVRCKYYIDIYEEVSQISEEEDGDEDED